MTDDLDALVSKPIAQRIRAACADDEFEEHNVLAAIGLIVVDACRAERERVFKAVEAELGPSAARDVAERLRSIPVV